MKNDNKNLPTKQHSLSSPRKARSQIIRLAIAAVCAASVPAAALAEVTFQPSLEVSATWIDNIELARENDLNQPKETEYVLQSIPGFTFAQKAPRMTSNLHYQAQNLFYQEDSDRNSTYHQAELAANIEVLRDYFFIDGTGRYSQQVVNPQAPTNNHLLFDVTSVADALTAQVSPYFHHEFDSVRADLRYQRGIVRYESGADAGIGVLQDVETEQRTAEFSNADEQARLGWGARYEYQEARYDLSPPFRFESASLDLSLLITRALRIIGSGTKESDSAKDTTQGGLDRSAWDAGFRWQPSERTRLEATYGEHFFGESYNATFRHEARRFSMSANYIEGPMTQAQELVLRPVVTSTTPSGTFVPTTDSFNSITNDVFVRRDAETDATLKGQRTQIIFKVHRYERTYISGARVGAVESNRGGSVGFTRRMSGTLDFSLNGTYATRQLENNPAAYEYKDVLATATLTKQVSQHAQMWLEGNRVRGSGGYDYVANWVTLGLRGQF